MLETLCKRTAPTKKGISYDISTHTHTTNLTICDQSMMTRSMIERLLVRPDELFSGHLDEFHLTEGREEENIQNKKGRRKGKKERQR